MNKDYIKVNPNDNVAIALKNFSSGDVIQIDNNSIVIKQDLSVGERIAVKNIDTNCQIVQYGSSFALAKYDIEAGCSIVRENITDIEIDIDNIDLKNFEYSLYTQNVIENFVNDFKDRTFMGFDRKNGVGTRNYYVVIPTSFCATDITVKLMNHFDIPAYLDIYKNIDGIVAAGHTEGCGCGAGTIIDRVLSTIRNTIDNPNCGGALIVDLGCEQTNYNVINKYIGDLEQFGKPIDFITIQSLGGTQKAFEKGVEIIENRLSKVNDIRRTPQSLDKIVLGTECGASDSFSGITANPLIGAIADNIIDLKGKAILSETPEMLGAENILLNRMESLEVKQKFVDGLNYYKDLASVLEISMSGNLVAGNLKGGLVNLTLKSLGSIQKGGSRKIVDFLDYGEKISKSGLSLMNGPGNDFESVTGLASSGANIILFSTGRGTTEGSLITPVIKIASNTTMYNKLNDDMDFNAGSVLEHGLEKCAYELMEYFIKVASGDIKTSSQRHKKRAFQIWSAGKLSL